MAITSFDHNAFDGNSFNAEDGPITVHLSVAFVQTEEIVNEQLTATKEAEVAFTQAETIYAYMREIAPIYTPPVSPNVDLIFRKTGIYVPPVSPNVDLIFGLYSADTSSGGDVSNNSQFFLLF